MVVGTTLLYLDGNAYYSPEFGRGGLAATFAVDVTQLNLVGASQFLIEVEHRNAEEVSFTTVGVFSGISSTGAASSDIGSLKEFVRFKYTFTGGTPAADDAVHFLMQAPSWRPY